MLAYASHIGWKRAVGLLGTIAVGICVFFLFRYVTAAPIAAPIFLWAVVASAYYGGLYSGLASAAIAIAFGLAFLSEPGQFLVFNDTNLTRLMVLSIIGPAIATTVGLLHAREKRALRTERSARQQAEDANHELSMLRAALEQVDYGVVLLDRELRAVFINQAFRVIWNLSDEKANGRPPFVALMYHGRDTGAYAVPVDELDAYVSERVARVRRGQEEPLDLRLANGEVIRFKCKTVPGGGRMLTYTSVTDLVRQADELQTLATTDPLTGLFNRRRFFALAEAEWVRAGRHGRFPSLLMIDIDRFKSVNDRFGHGVGDKVIARVANVCRTTKRELDILARVGGEEFAILLPETSEEEACALAERIGAHLRESGTMADLPVKRVTVSIGAAQAGAEVDSIRELMTRADAALYDAKRQGRDRVVPFTPRPGRQVA